MANETRHARDEELALLFTAARTHYAWLPEPVEDALLYVPAFIASIWIQ